MSHPVIQAIRSGAVPKPAKLAAARALLPLAPEESLEALVLLSQDEDAEVRDAAVKSLGSFDKAQMQAAAANKETSPDVLTHLCAWRSGAREFYEALVLNLKTPGEGVAKLAGWHRDGSLLELITINQQRLIDHPAIIEAVCANASRTPEAERRAREVKVEFFEKELGAKRVAEERRARAAAVSAALGLSHVVEIAADLIDDDLPIEELLIDDKILMEKFHFELPPEEAEAEMEWSFNNEDLLAEEIPLSAAEQTEAQRIIREKEEEETSLNEIERKIVRLIAKLKVKTKVKLALTGNRQTRGLLMRDSSKLVVTAVLSNPKITEQEIETMTKMKSLPAEGLRMIGLNRAWSRNYLIIHNLVVNPRTPLATSLPLLNRILPKDLKGLVGNRNVPDVIRKSAQRLVQARGPA